MYYIKPTYPDNDFNCPNVLFHSWLGKYEVIDNNDNLTFNGEYYIYSNSNLPFGSFYLNFKTFFASITNINLIFNKNITTQKKDNTTTYKIDLYNFSFDIPLKESQFFNEQIVYKNIEFNFKPNINLSIFSDYKISVDQLNLDKFMTNLQHSTQYSAFLYKNTFVLNEGSNQINISLNQDQSSNLYIDVNSLKDLNKPINNLLVINKLDNEPFIINKIDITIKYYYKNTQKDYCINIKNKKIYDNKIVLTLPNLYIYDQNINNITISNGMNGIYIPSSYGKINCAINFNYHNKTRTLLIDRDFNFNENNDYKSVDIKDYKNNKKLLGEVQNEKIY